MAYRYKSNTVKYSIKWYLFMHSTVTKIFATRLLGVSQLETTKKQFIISIRQFRNIN